MDVKVERTVAAPQDKVFAAWLDPSVDGCPFKDHDELVLTPKVGALWYWLVHSQHHYGRFLEINPPTRILHTWVSRYSAGLETIVTITFEKKANATRVVLRHTGLPNAEYGEAHREAWQRILGELQDAMA